MCLLSLSFCLCLCSKFLTYCNIRWRCDEWTCSTIMLEDFLSVGIFVGFLPAHSNSFASVLRVWVSLDWHVWQLNRADFLNFHLYPCLCVVLFEWNVCVCDSLCVVFSSWEKGGIQKKGHKNNIFITDDLWVVARWICLL